MNNFSNVSPNMLKQMNNKYQTANYNQTFVPNTPIVPHQVNLNKQQLLVDNLGENVLAENIIEYTLHIDSSDRDPTLYLNQFKFPVHFGDKTQPNIARKFKNVKYIKLENVIIPTIYKVCASGVDPSGTLPDPSNNNFSSDPNYNTLNERYLLLKMKELTNERVLSTGNIVKSDTVKLYYDVELNSYYNSWTTNQNSFVFPNSNLGNLKKLTFELYDSYGNQLLFQGLVPSAPETNITNPLNKYTQLAVTLVIGVIENEINTDPNYEN